MPFMIEQIMLVAHNAGIYSLDHALMCNLNIKRVVGTGKKDPFTVRALQYWAELGYTRTPFGNIYEEIASRFIFISELKFRSQLIAFLTLGKTWLPTLRIVEGILTPQGFQM